MTVHRLLVLHKRHLARDNDTFKTHSISLALVDSVRPNGSMTLATVSIFSLVLSSGRPARKGSLFAFHVRVARYHLRPRLYRIVAETECARISGSVGLAPPGQCEMSCSVPDWRRHLVQVQ